LLIYGVVVCFGVDSIELEIETTVDFRWVHCLEVGNWSFLSVEFFSLHNGLGFSGIPLLLGGFLLGNLVLRVVLVSSLQSNLVIKLILVNGLEVGLWSLFSVEVFSFPNGLGLSSIPLLLGGLLLGDLILRVVLITGLESQTVPKFILVN
jgi:hypothetical protein